MNPHFILTIIITIILVGLCMFFYKKNGKDFLKLLGVIIFGAGLITSGTLIIPNYFTVGDFRGGDWWDSNWKYRTKIYAESFIPTNISNTLVLINFSTTGFIANNKMRSDCGDVRFGDSNSNELQYTLETSTCNTSQTLFWVWINLTGNANTTIYAYYGKSDATLPTDYTNPDEDLILYLHLDNSSAYGENDTKVFDFSKDGNNGSVIGAAPTSSGNFGGGYDFFGTNDLITGGNTDLGGDFTYSAWIRPHSMSSYAVIVTFNGVDRWFGLYNLVLHTYTGSGSDYNYGTALSPDTWYHVVLTSNTTHLKVYRDGSQVGSDYSPPQAPLPTITGSYTIGNDIYVEDYDGTIDELRIYNRTLTLEEIQAIYNSTKDHYIENQTGTGEPDTNFTIWNGTNWEQTPRDYQPWFRCEENTNECEPINQNASESQGIFRICNNGTESGTNVYMNINRTFVNISLFCDDDYTPTGSVNLTTSNQSIYGTLSSNSCIDVCCWLNLTIPPSGYYFSTRAYVVS